MDKLIVKYNKLWSQSKRVKRVVDKNKLINFLTKKLVDASRAGNTTEMNVFHELIKITEQGAFGYDYGRLEHATNNYDEYVSV